MATEGRAVTRMFWAGLAVLCGCHHSQPTARSPATASVQNTFSDLKRHEHLLVSSELTTPLRSKPIPLSEKEHATIVKAISGCTHSDQWAMTPPPWDALLVVRARDGRRWFIQLTAAVFRMDRANPRSPSLASIQRDRPTVEDCALDDDDYHAIWSIFADHLGAPRGKSYRPSLLPSRPHSP